MARRARGTKWRLPRRSLPWWGWLLLILALVVGAIAGPVARRGPSGTCSWGLSGSEVIDRRHAAAGERSTDTTNWCGRSRAARTRWATRAVGRRGHAVPQRGSGSCRRQSAVGIRFGTPGPIRPLLAYVYAGEMLVNEIGPPEARRSRTEFDCLLGDESPIRQAEREAQKARQGNLA